MKQSVSNAGVCALTGQTGKFVKSHLIPKAFSRRAGNDPFVEFSENSFPKRYFDSWYDKQLVVEEGEKVLAELDQFAAKTLLNRKLIYRERRNPDLSLRIGKIDQSVIIPVRCDDMTRLHRFALSLYWRAAATAKNYGALVEPNADTIELLRQITLGLRNPMNWEYPVRIGVFDSVSEVTKSTPNLVSVLEHRYVRFFLDGLVIYISESRIDPNYERFGKLVLGSDNKMNLLVLPSRKQGEEASDRLINLIQQWGNPWPKTLRI